MSLTVEDAMALEPLCQGRLLAGRSGMSRQITWVHILEVFEEPLFFKQGYLLLSTPFGLEGNEFLQEKIFSAADEAGLSGIVIKVGFELEKVPENLVKLADRYAIPLVEIAKEIPFTELSRVVLSELINRQFVLLKRSQAIHEKLIRVELRGGGFKEIAQTLSRAIQQSVIIVNLRSTVIASSILNPRSLGVSAEVFGEGQVLPSYYFSALGSPTEIGERFLDTRFFRLPAHSPSGLPGFTFAPIIFDNKIYGAIGILEKKILEELDIRALEHGATIAALEFLKRKVERETERRLEGDLIDDLLSGASIAPEVLERRLKFLGYDLSKPCRVLAIGIDSFAQKHADSLPAEVEVHKIKEKLYDLVHRYFQTEPYTAL